MTRGIKKGNTMKLFLTRKGKKSLTGKFGFNTPSVFMRISAQLLVTPLYA